MVSILSPGRRRTEVLGANPWPTARRRKPLRQVVAGLGRRGVVGRAAEVMAPRKARALATAKPTVTAWITYSGFVSSRPASTVVKIAPARPRPSVLPSVRAVERIPEATPRLPLGTAPITALLFGVPNRPTPTPIKTRFTTI